MRNGQICHCGSHGWAALTRGYVTIVDPEHAVLFSLWSWHTYANHGNVYARRKTSKTIDGRKYTIQAMLHHIICPVSNGLVVDHLDGDGLNNRAGNLQPTLSILNSHRQKKKASATSAYRGVSIYHGRWRVTLQKGGRQVYVGVFQTEDEAARAYDIAAQALYGRSALLNYPTPNCGVQP